MSIATVFGVGFAKSLVVDREFPSFRFFVASGFTAFGLSVAADVSPSLAAPFSLLVMTVVLMNQGVDLATALAELEEEPIDPYSEEDLARLDPRTRNLVKALRQPVTDEQRRRARRVLDRSRTVSTRPPRR